MAKQPKLTVDEKTAVAIAVALESVAAELKGSYGQGVVVHALTEVAARLRSGKL